ncbi:MAG: cytochrome c-type biosis protein [Actinomycetota bacterium]|nr:cytochrome biosis protein [Glaciihabitans sp.]MDQ1544410.1 cytochrome c-type biosis protein [Actinomycetota bacterium]
MGSIGAIVENGNILLALALALVAGFISFASPCILPLVPGYLGYIGGFTTEAERPGRRRMLLGVALFVLGFTVVFVGFGILFGTASLFLKQNLDLITRIAGVIVIVLGLVFVGQFTFLQRTIRPRWTVMTGLAGAPILGLVFGLGWTPCIGPTLTAVYSIALDGGSPWRGALLGLLFCVGLGVPFLLVALGFNWVSSSMRWLKRHIRLINIIGGAILIAIGVLMVTGVWHNVLSVWLSGVNNGFVPVL